MSAAEPQATAPAMEQEGFSLVLHIGAGKTGTSSIQATLRSQRARLKEQGIYYLGLMLEYAPLRLFDWQKPSGAHEFLTLEPSHIAQQVQEVIRTSLPSLRAAGCHRAIWSNEWFFDHGTGAIIEAMQRLRAEGMDVQVIAYIRRHDAWVRSAYVQWGLKHKTYTGPLLPFDQWIRSRNPRFSQRLRPWLTAFGDDVQVRNLDTAGDAVTDFMHTCGIAPAGLDPIRSNETPSGEELTVRAMFNAMFADKVPVDRFDRVIGKDTRFDQTLHEWLTALMPDEQAMQQVAAACRDDRVALDRLLATTGQPPMDTAPWQPKPLKVDSEKVLAALCQLVLRHAVKIHGLEQDMNQEAGYVRGSAPDTHREPRSISCDPGAQHRPVFVISTGRSGSTLVQRVLNCHRELVIWGEHFGFIESLASAYAQMLNPQQELYRSNPGPSVLLPTLQDPAAQLEWTNPWDVEDFKRQTRDFIEGYFAGRLHGQRWGFKEIRYNSLPVLRMLRDLFPEGRFIFVMRDAVDVTRSKVFSFIKEDKWAAMDETAKVARIAHLIREVRAHYQVYETFVQRNPGRGIVVAYEDLVADPQEVTGRMLAHLDLHDDDFDWPLCEQVLGNVIAKTRRDDGMVQLIRDVAASVARECA